MFLYEVIRYGNDSDDVFSGGPNGPDTCFLVRAATPEQAAALVDEELARFPSDKVVDWCRVVYLLGKELTADTGQESVPRILRGPYLEHAYRHGWRQWSRWEQNDPWVEA